MVYGRMGRRRAGVALVLAGALAAMGVIVSTSSAKTSAPKAGSTGTLNIGIITSVGGTIIDYPFTVSAGIAGVRAINKAGRVNGYKLGVVYCNTQGDPNQE